MAETQSARFAHGRQAAVDARAEELLKAAHVYGADPKSRRDLPDVHEGDHGELAAPAERQRDAAQEREQHVAAVFRAREAFVRVPPNTRGAVSRVRLADYVFKRHLQKPGVIVIV